MKSIFQCAAFIVIGFGCSISAFAQSDQSRVINGGILNGKSVSLPKPEYPSDAREAGAEGTVLVRVTIDEEGNVISAEANPVDQRVKKIEEGVGLNTAEVVELHPSLMAAAEKAALDAKFSPTLLSGQPVKVTGNIIYNFVANSRSEETPASGISGGVLNGKALSLPKPIYPAAAAAVRAEGAVTVRIVIDENGDITFAESVSGHPLLRASAVQAARAAKFSPTQLEGNPVKVSGVLIYNFVLPKTQTQ